MVREEKITRSPAASLMAGCSFSAMRAMAARGSPWLPVASTTILSRGRAANMSSERNGGRPSRKPHSRATWITRSIARPTIDDAAAGRLRRLRHGADARDIGGEGRHEHAMLGLADELAQRLRDIALGGAVALAQNVGRIADQRVDALVAERAQPRRVGAMADAGLGIDLPVAGVDGEAERRADARAHWPRGSNAPWRSSSTSKGPMSSRSPVATVTIFDIRRAGLAETARLEQAGGETRRIDRAAELRPQQGQGADMILMRMGDDEPDEIAADLLDEGDVGHQRDRRRAAPGRERRGRNRPSAICARRGGPKP